MALEYVLNTCYLSRSHDTVTATILAHGNGLLANEYIRDKACYAQTVIMPAHCFIIDSKKIITVFIVIIKQIPQRTMMNFVR